MHYYQFNIGDYQSHTGHLDPLEDIAYRRMLDWCYLHEQPLPNDIQQIAKLVRMRDHQATVRDVLNEFFYLTDEGWYQTRIGEEIKHYHSKIEQASRAGKASAERRINARSTPVQQTDSVRSTDEQPNKKQEPGTKNQEPDIDPKGSRDFDQSKPPTCPVKEIVDLYNKLLPELPACTVLNDGRKKAIAARWREVVTTDKMTKTQGVEFFEWFFTMVRDSDFLMGRKKDWKADIDFLFTASKFPRIVEGVYHRSEK